MKTWITITLLLIGFSFGARADHITGGEMFYTFLGVSNGQYQYSVTLKLFMRCNSGRQFNNPSIVSIFDKVTSVRIMDMNISLTRKETISLSDAGPCVTNPPTVCYEVGYYIFTVTLPASTHGYVLASQVNYRIAGISNLAPNYGLIGATYTTDIPGTGETPDGPANNSAKFTANDLVVVCGNNSFSYSFAATDPDGDQLYYFFCNAYKSSVAGPGNANPPPSPPYISVPYGSPAFSGSDPLGVNVQIDHATGLITGLAPREGIYVVTVCVQEIRNGTIIAIQHKDIQINIANCSIAAASLQPEYMLCRDTKTIALSNLSVSPLINSYNWQLLNQTGKTLFSSTDANINYTFTDTGTYIVKLAVNKGQQCSDSSSSLVRVYPGFVPDFDVGGLCILRSTTFTDLTTSLLGTVNTWTWDFGDADNTSDISYLRNPTYSYSSIGNKIVSLIVTNTVGCRDTVTKNLPIIDKPPITLLFRDTLICVSDAVQLRADGKGNFSWTPNASMIAANTPTPTVSPPSTTKYYVELDDNGCHNKDSLQVRVTDHVNLQAMNDTTICRGDTIQLRVISDGFVYTWTPPLQIITPGIANPLVVTNSLTPYQVTANIGSCYATDEIIVKTVPYPVADAGIDTVICYNTFVQLHASTDGSSWNWQPPISLNNAASLSPVAKPHTTMNYTFFSYDNKGCPKPGTDEILVTVLPEIKAFAGNDTSVVISQPLQLHASGGEGYLWSPSSGLSDSTIADPIALYKVSSPGIKYKVWVYNEAGCVDSAYLLVKIFKTAPVVFVPNAFTPNGDGRNDVLRPIAAGIANIEYFNVYNRYGQLVFTTHVNEYGWDGRVNGRAQETGTYVWIVKGLDYTGAPYIQKGTVLLIR